MDISLKVVLFGKLTWIEKYVLFFYLKTKGLIETKSEKLKMKYIYVKYARKGHLKTHSRIQSEDKPYMCEVCPATLIKAYNLQGNSRIHSGDSRIHSGETPYQCELCPASFTETGSLKMHSRIHSGENPIDVKYVRLR